MLNEVRPPAPSAPVDPEEEDDTPDVIVEEETGEAIVQPPRSRGRLFRRGGVVALVVLVLLLVYLTLTAPLSKSLQPITAPSITLLSAEGQPIARRGSITDLPVDAATLPAHIPGAFLAIEDRRFYRHLGVDPWGIARAAVRNLGAGGVVEGGSTISQQLAKLAFLSSDQTAARKVQEAIMAVWLEAWLDKDEILSRYLSSVYFGDNVYGLRAAANHYFSRKPEDLTPEQAAMLAGLVKAPSTLAPTKNLEGARERGALVQQAMVEAGYLTAAEAEELPEVKIVRGEMKKVPTGTYFADWLFANELADRERLYGEQRIVTTLEDRLQRQAVNAVRQVGTGGAEVALLAMRPDGQVVAMVGGKSYRRSPFNRAVQAKRQPGSTFKLFVYLAALRAGYSPGDAIQDVPIRIGDWSPQNYENRYRGTISLRDAFAVSSNVAAVQLAQSVGRDRVISAARDLGVESDIEEGPAMALGTSTLSLMEMTKAFAAFAGGNAPVTPHGLPETEVEDGTPLESGVRADMLDLLNAVTTRGSGRAAALPVQTFGKTGTSQDGRDAWFIGFAGDLVTGVWIGHDDNRPMGDVGGGGTPARIWRAFMEKAVDRSAAGYALPPPDAEIDSFELPSAPDPLGNVYSDYDVEQLPGPAPSYSDPAVYYGADDQYALPPAEPEPLPREGEQVFTPTIDAPPAPGVREPAPPPAAERAPPRRTPPPPRRPVPTIEAPPPPAPPPEEEPVAPEGE